MIKQDETIHVEAWLSGKTRTGKGPFDEAVEVILWAVEDEPPPSHLRMRSFWVTKDKVIT